MGTSINYNHFGNIADMSGDNATSSSYSNNGNILNALSQKFPQTVTFGTAPNLFVGGTETVSATATSGLAVAFTSSFPNICTISGTTVTGVEIGSCKITADQGGNGTYNPAPQASQSFTIAVAPKTTSTTTLNPSANPVLVGQTVTLNALVSGSAGIPTGSIVFEDGSTTLATTPLIAGSANFYSNAFTIGSHSLTADYSGDSTYLASQGLLNLLVSSTISTTTKVSTAPNPSQIGSSINVTATVTPASNVGTLSGTVSVSGGSQNCTITPPDNSCILSFATKGRKDLTATYSGNSFYASSTGTAKHYVGNKPSITPILMLLLE